MGSTDRRSPWLVGRLLLLAMAVSGHATLVVLRRLGLYGKEQTR
jgi:hypothetical protein